MEDPIKKIIKNAEVVKDKEQLAIYAAKYFIEVASEAIKKNGICNVAISGGKSPIDFYKLIPDSVLPDDFAWDKIQLFWVDERCVDPSSDESNYKLALDTFISKIPIPESNIHRVIAEYENYSYAVKDYEQNIRDHFHIKVGEIPVFDLICLGVGADGHIGSLFPNSYALFDTEDIVAIVYQMDNSTLDRITLTVPVLQASSHLMVLITGAQKATIVRRIFESEPDEVKYPVHALWPVLDKVHWIIDEDASRSLHIGLHHV